MLMWFYDVILKYYLASLICFISCIWIYFHGKKHQHSNNIFWAIVNIFFPLIGLIGYLINLIYIKLKNKQSSN